MRFLKLFAGSMSLLLAMQVEAQGSQRSGTERGGYEMTKRSFTGQKEEFALALRYNDRAFLRASPSQFLDEFQIADPNANLKTVQDLYEYVMSLTETACGVGEGKFTRIMMPSGELKHDLVRKFKKGETCLVNPRTGRAIVSTDCGNTLLWPRNIAYPGAPTGTIASLEAKIDSLNAEVEKLAEDTIRLKNQLAGMNEKRPSFSITANDSVGISGNSGMKWYNTSITVTIDSTTFYINIKQSPKAIVTRTSGVSKKTLIFSNLISAAAGFGAGYYVGDQLNVQQSVVVNGQPRPIVLFQIVR